MPITKAPYKLDLDLLGVIEGVSYIDNSPSVPNANRPYPNNGSPKTLCHYFGGIPYALPPIGPYRFKRPRAIPPCYRYGTHVNPGRFDGLCGVCPQPTVPPEQWEEDCLQLSIWMPSGEAPKGGWPVLFFIHGGFLQWGSPNGGDLTALLGEGALNAIVVKPAYRLNLFGFLAGKEIAAENPPFSDLNVGFWDQRLALEWVYKKISYFGGDPSNISIAGYSAGSHSVFHQLSYDMYQPSGKQIVKRAMMWSNGPGVQPHSLVERQTQFDELLAVLGIDADLSGEEKMTRLRALPAQDLVAANDRMKLHEFRATTDGSFVTPQLFSNIANGDFAKRLKDRNVPILIGECRDEHFVYGAWRPSKSPTYQGCFDRLLADYPRKTVETLMRLYSPERQLPKGCKDWGDAFGRIYADCQVHNMERGFINELDRHGAGDLVKRYRVEWRAKCADRAYPPEWGVCHGSDLAIWFYGNGTGDGLQQEEKKISNDFVLAPLDAFLQSGATSAATDDQRQLELLEQENKRRAQLAGQRSDTTAADTLAQPTGQTIGGSYKPDAHTSSHFGHRWGTGSVREVRRLKPDGQVEIWQDDMWEKGVQQWAELRRAGCLGTIEDRAKL